MNNNKQPQPRVTGISVHNVTAKDIETVVTVFDTFTSVTIGIGRTNFTLFTDSLNEANEVLVALAKATIEQGLV